MEHQALRMAERAGQTRGYRVVRAGKRQNLAAFHKPPEAFPCVQRRRAWSIDARLRAGRSKSDEVSKGQRALHGLKARASVLGIAQPMTGQPHVTRAGPRCSPIGIDRIQERTSRRSAHAPAWIAFAQACKEASVIESLACLRTAFAGHPAHGMQPKPPSRRQQPSLRRCPRRGHPFRTPKNSSRYGSIGTFSSTSKGADQAGRRGSTTPSGKPPANRVAPCDPSRHAPVNLDGLGPETSRR